MSGSDSGDDFTTERGINRLRNVLFHPKRAQRGTLIRLRFHPCHPGGAHDLAFEAQRLNESAKAFVSRIGESLTVELPEELKRTEFADDMDRNLDTSEHQRFLEDQTHLVIQERQREIQETQKRLEQALKELEIAKHEEEQILQQKVVECQKEYLESMSNLQTQFLRQADDLKMTTLTQLAQYRSQCETNIESKARALCTHLATDSRTCSPSPRSSRASPMMFKEGSARDSPLHARIEGLHRKAISELKTPKSKLKPQWSEEVRHESSRRSSERRQSNPAIERGLKFANSEPSYQTLSKRGSGTRRSFLELLESDDE